MADTCGPDGTESTASGLIFLLDVDNTLLDNDGLKAYFRERILAAIGPAFNDEFWSLYERVREEEDYVDYPETLRRFVAEYGSDVDVQALESVFDAPPFASFLYPDTMDTLAHMRALGTPVILSDGDQVFQARKIRESGLAAAVDDRVLIYVHKENELSAVFAQFPGRHYIMVDDKARIRADLSRACPSTFTTVHVLQGHYADDGPYTPAPDFEVHNIGELQSFTLGQLEKQTASAAAPTAITEES
jgi:FMN phosphatase YigB (HAD superfamily)